MAKVKLGLVGCGGMMGAHVRQLEPVKSATIAALMDPSRAMMSKFKERFPQLADVPTFRDYKKMIDSVELDGVIIASPHTVHAEQILTCLDSGLHVLTEKPMVCSVADAKAVIKKANQKKRILMISYQRHFSPAFRAAREMVQSGKIGNVTYIAALQGQEWLKGTKGTWRQKPGLSGGGQLNDSASHLLDIILWVTDLQPLKVFARVDNRGSAVDINSSLTVSFKGGAIGNIAIVGDAPGWWEEVAYYGEKGAVYIRRDRILLQLPNPSGWGATTEDVTDKVKYNGTPDKNFVDSILGKDEPQTPPIWGLRVIQLTEAAWESGKSGKPVAVKL
ncbi:MAG: Gfo/Idh/MocA family oxidoreductase [Armatimonadota bacterium]